MQKLLSYFVALFVLFFACTQNQPETTTTNTPTTPKTSKHSEIPVSTPIPAPEDPPEQHANTVPQAPKKDLKYPRKYKELGVPQLAQSTVANNIMLDNDLGKYGQRIKLNGNGTHEATMGFYAKALEKNGWEKNHRMDKNVEDEDVKFFSTNYSKDNYTLMLAITGTTTGKLYIDQILKEN